MLRTNFWKSICFLLLSLLENIWNVPYQNTGGINFAENRLCESLSASRLLPKTCFASQDQEGAWWLQTQGSTTATRHPSTPVLRRPTRLRTCLSETKRCSKIFRLLNFALFEITSSNETDDVQSFMKTSLWNF